MKLFAGGEAGRRGLLRLAPVAAVIALGVVLRFQGLGGDLVWHDEVATRIFVAGHTPEEWRAALYTGEVFGVREVRRFQGGGGGHGVAETVLGLARTDPQHPPLYYVLARIWVGVAGDGIGALRALSALLGLLGLPAMFWLCRELYGSTRVAWTGVALFAVSPFFVLYGREAREYALWGVLVMLSCAALLRAVRLGDREGEPPRRRRGAWAAWALIALVSLYTSFSTAAVLASQGLFVLLREGFRPTRTVRAFTGAAALAVLGFLPWAVNLPRHYEAFEASMRWSREIVVPRLSLLRILVLNASRVVVDLWPELDRPPAWGVDGLAVALAVGALVAVTRRAPPKAAALILPLVAVPIALLLGPDLLFGGIRSLSGRYMTPSWIGVLAALAFLLGSPPPRGVARPGLLLGAVLGLGIASGLANAGREAPWTKGTSVRLPQVAALINRSRSPLVVGNMEAHHPGDLLALSNLLDPGASMQFLRYEMEAEYVLPPGFRDVYLYGPLPSLLARIEEREGARLTLLHQDQYRQIWRAERLGSR